MKYLSKFQFLKYNSIFFNLSRLAKSIFRREYLIERSIHPHVIRVNGKLLLCGDGLKVPKEGRSTEIASVEKWRLIIGIYRSGLLRRDFCNIFPQRSHSLYGRQFGSWIRTIRPGICPSERVTAIAMKNTFPEFLVDSSQEAILTELNAFGGLLDRITG